jgi:hypothetical protein
LTFLRRRPLWPPFLTEVLSLPPFSIAMNLLGTNRRDMLMSTHPIARAVGNDSRRGAVDCGGEILRIIAFVVVGETMPAMVNTV